MQAVLCCQKLCLKQTANLILPAWSWTWSVFQVMLESTFINMSHLETLNRSFFKWSFSWKLNILFLLCVSEVYWSSTLRLVDTVTTTLPPCFICAFRQLLAFPLSSSWSSSRASLISLRPVATHPTAAQETVQGRTAALRASSCRCGTPRTPPWATRWHVPLSTLWPSSTCS